MSNIDKGEWDIGRDGVIDKLLSDLIINKNQGCEWSLGMDDLRYFGSVFYPRMVGKIWKEDIDDAWLWRMEGDKKKTNIHRYLVYYLKLLHDKLRRVDPRLMLADPLPDPPADGSSFSFKTYSSIRNLIKYFCSDKLVFNPIKGYHYEFLIHNSGMGLPVIERPYDSLSLHYFYANRITYRPPISLPFFENDFVALEYVHVDDVDLDIGKELEASTLGNLDKTKRDQFARWYKSDKEDDRKKLFPPKPIGKNELARNDYVAGFWLFEAIKSLVRGSFYSNVSEDKKKIEFLSWLDLVVDEQFDERWRSKFSKSNNSRDSGALISIYNEVIDFLRTEIEGRFSVDISFPEVDTVKELREKLSSHSRPEDSRERKEVSDIVSDKSLDDKGNVYQFVADLFEQWHQNRSECLAEDKNWLLESGILVSILNLLPRLISQWWYDDSILARKSDSIEARYLAVASVTLETEEAAKNKAEKVRRILTREPLGVHRAFVESEENRSLIFRRFLSSILEKPLLGIQYNGLQFDIKTQFDTHPDKVKKTSVCLTQNGFKIDVGSPPFKEVAFLEIAEGKAGNPMFTTTHSTS